MKLLTDLVAITLQRIPFSKIPRFKDIWLKLLIINAIRNSLLWTFLRNKRNSNFQMHAMIIVHSNVYGNFPIDDDNDSLHFPYIIYSLRSFIYSNTFINLRYMKYTLCLQFSWSRIVSIHTAFEFYFGMKIVLLWYLFWWFVWDVFLISQLKTILITKKVTGNS